jgi:phosphoenolpyruvate carboxylase
MPLVNAADRDALADLLEAGVEAHTATLLRIAPLLAPFGGLVPQTRVRIRATGSVNYGRSIPEYPEEWGGGRVLPDNRDLRDAWPEGVTLPRAINYNLGCTHAAARHQLQPRLHHARSAGRGERPQRPR